MAEAARGALFVCYSHTDRAYRERFETYLRSPALEGQGIEIFSDARIESSDKWQTEILEALDRADAALVLVSQEVMVSPFIQQVELRALLESNVRRGLRMYLVPVSPTLYQGSPLEQFQWAMPPEKPLSSMSESDQRDAMVKVCLQIAKQFGTLPDTPTIERTIEGLRNLPRLDLPSTFELRAPLGEGQFARCFRGRDRLLNRPVVIKIINAQLARDSDAYDKYVESASRLDHHPNILGVYFSEADKVPNFIVTPDVGDETLEDKMEKAETWPTFEKSLEWTICLADTLAYAHDRKCVHGRLRPCEIRFYDDAPMLSGFRTIESCERGSTVQSDWRLDLEDFQYASPEYRTHRRTDPKGDQYLLGMIAYEMIKGWPRASLKDWGSVLTSTIALDLVSPHPLKTISPHCDERVSDVIMRMLSVDPSCRWDSMSEVRQRLDDALTNLLSVAEAKRSYREFALDTAFYAEVYRRLFDEIPSIKGMFRKKRTLEEQYEVLRDALWLLISYPSTREKIDGKEAEPTILSRIAYTHAEHDPTWFDTFGKLVRSVVETRDPSAAKAWEYAMKPGLNYLRERAGKGAPGRRPLSNSITGTPANLPNSAEKATLCVPKT